MLILIRIVPFRDDFSGRVGPRLGACREKQNEDPIVVSGADQGPALHLKKLIWLRHEPRCEICGLRLNEESAHRISEGRSLSVERSALSVERSARRGAAVGLTIGPRSA